MSIRPATILVSFFVLCVTSLFAGNEKDYTYLALGDSVAFGMNPLLLPPYSMQTPTPDQFVGYPEFVAAAEHLLQPQKEVDASCPGETSGSFLDVNSLDNGCNSPHIQPPPLPPLPPFKTTIGLHTPYTEAQILFAESQLMSNKHIDLVTLSIGANDMLLVLPELLPLLAACGNNIACVQMVLDPTLTAYKANLGQILTRVRAHYQGTLILLTYYSPAPALDGLVILLNAAMQQEAGVLAAQPGFLPVKFADGFTAFQLASAAFNHDACAAGLVLPLPPVPPPPTPCDVHPSQLGQQVLAGAIMAAQQ